MSKRFIKRLFNGVGLDVRRLPAYGTTTLAFLREYRINSVLDIGANTGQFAQEVRRVLPSAYLYSFEPLREEFCMLVKNAGADDHRFRAFNIALGEKDEERVMFKHNFTPSSSLLRATGLQKITFPDKGEVTETTVTVRTLDKFVAESHIRMEPELFIKLDVQGYEKRVVEGGLQTFNAAKVVMTEENYYEFYEGQPSFEELFSLLSRIGFQYKGHVNPSYHSATGLPLFADGIFVRS